MGNVGKALKIAIIGCGKIADSHASQIQRIDGCEIVGVCDREPLMARQLFERFPVTACFDDVGRLLADAKPDVVHVTTPPQGHFDIAMRCLDAGANVYVEKPFTLYTHEAEALIERAIAKGLKITAGHDDQFTWAARRMRSLINSGYLGGSPVHMESYHCYDLSNAAFARALLTDRRHWVRSLPGKLLQNIISHGIARIAEFLETDTPRVIAHGFVSPLLTTLDEHDIVDELRVVITDEARMTAYFTFSSQMRPSLHQFRVYGPRNGLVLDYDQDSLVQLRGTRITSFGEKFIPQLNLAAQHLENFSANLKCFLARDFHMKSGMKYLIESFYRSITDGTDLPLSYREILLTSRIMDDVFAQLAAGPSARSGSEHYKRAASSS